MFDKSLSINKSGVYFLDEVFYFENSLIELLFSLWEIIYFRFWRGVLVPFDSLAQTKYVD